jgi:hypothetical protein
VLHIQRSKGLLGIRGLFAFRPATAKSPSGTLSPATVELIAPNVSSPNDGSFHQTSDDTAAADQMPYHISRIVSSDQTLNLMLAELVGVIVRVTGCNACLVYLADHLSGEVVLRASHPPHGAELGTIRMQLGEGITDWVAERKDVVAIAANASSDSRSRHFPALVEATFEALLSVPIVSEGKVAGVVNVHYRNVRAHSQDEVALVSFVGEQMGGAIRRASLREENVNLRKETQEATQQLETRKRVERAKGILQIRHCLSEEDAYLRLRNESRRIRRTMGELAEAIILGEEIAAPRNFGERPTSERWRENHQVPEPARRPPTKSPVGRRLGVARHG